MNCCSKSIQIFWVSLYLGLMDQLQLITGCITSAETVLIEQQSADQVYKLFNQKQELLSSGKEDEAPFIVFSLALQPLLSIAHKIGKLRY